VQDSPTVEHADRSQHVRAVAREFLAAALYLGIVLLAALAAVPRDRLPDDGVIVGTMLGVSVGLVLAHWYAFRLASHVTSETGRRPAEAAQEAGAQIAGGVSVAVLASLPFLITDGDAALTLAFAVLAALPPLTGAAIARLRGGSWLVTGLLAGGTLVVTTVIVLVKNAFGH
jgi:hypothetical protein